MKNRVSTGLLCGLLAGILMAPLSAWADGSLLIQLSSELMAQEPALLRIRAWGVNDYKNTVVLSGADQLELVALPLDTFSILVEDVHGDVIAKSTATLAFEGQVLDVTIE